MVTPNTFSLKGRLLYVGNFKLPNHNAACQRVLNNKNLFETVGFKVDVIGNAGPEVPGVGDFGFNVDFEHSGRLRSYISILFYILGNWTKYEHIVFYNHPVLINVVLILLKPFSYRKKIILDITEWYKISLRSSPRNWVKFIDVCLRNYLLWRISDRLIVTSDYYKDRYPSDQKRLNLPTLQPTSKGKDKVINPDKLRLIYFGNPFEMTNGVKSEKELLSTVLQSVLNYPGAELDVFGLKESDYREFYGHSMTSSNIRFHGVVAHEALVEMLPKYDASIFFRADTRVNAVGFPSKLSLSIANGLPVITSDIKSLRTLEKIVGVILLDSNGGRVPDLVGAISGLDDIRKGLVSKDNLHFYWGSFKHQATEFFD
jgi:hypothetical protein